MKQLRIDRIFEDGEIHLIEETSDGWKTKIQVVIPKSLISKIDTTRLVNVTIEIPTKEIL